MDQNRERLPTVRTESVIITLPHPEGIKRNLDIITF